MYIDWLHKERNDFIARTGIFANKVVIREDVYICLEREILQHNNRYGLQVKPYDTIGTIMGMDLEVVKFADKEFTFFKALNS